MQLNPNNFTIPFSPPRDLYLRSHLLHCSQICPFLLPRDCELYRDREHLLKYFEDLHKTKRIILKTILSSLQPDPILAIDVGG